MVFNPLPSTNRLLGKFIVDPAGTLSTKSNYGGNVGTAERLNFVYTTYKVAGGVLSCTFPGVIIVNTAGRYRIKLRFTAIYNSSSYTANLTNYTSSPVVMASTTHDAPAAGQIIADLRGGELEWEGQLAAASVIGVGFTNNWDSVSYNPTTLSMFSGATTLGQALMQSDLNFIEFYGQ